MWWLVLLITLPTVAGLAGVWYQKCHAPYHYLQVFEGARLVYSFQFKQAKEDTWGYYMNHARGADMVNLYRLWFYRGLNAPKQLREFLRVVNGGRVPSALTLRPPTLYALPTPHRDAFLAGLYQGGLSVGEPVQAKGDTLEYPLVFRIPAAA